MLLLLFSIIPVKSSYSRTQKLIAPFAGASEHEERTAFESHSMSKSAINRVILLKTLMRLSFAICSSFYNADPATSLISLFAGRRLDYVVYTLQEDVGCVWHVDFNLKMQ
ncbi:hypothetical protein Zmor_002292 [Zophobas morio]|uniref:Uncharacterized protein n=1 Tax=Zophobas morio TaxID=2755281 RepID=A0AA38MTF7_9CUCU|nr:hypothetical protein Zmor_002292 [Zophobas morio]